MEETITKTKRINFKALFAKLSSMAVTALSLITAVSASGSGGSSGGTTASAITDVGSALTGVIGYMAQTTSAILGDDLWILGMGFFVLSFVAGFVMYLFRVGRR